MKKSEPIPWHEMLGEEVTVIIQDVPVRDIVVKRFLPDGQAICGPRLTLGHIFARWTMLPQMDEVSDATERAIKKFMED